MRLDHIAHQLCGCEAVVRGKIWLYTHSRRIIDVYRSRKIYLEYAMSRKLKVKEHRDELSKRGLDTKGLKTALVARLDEAIASENKSVNAATDDDKAALSEIVTNDSKATGKRKVL